MEEEGDEQGIAVGALDDERAARAFGEDFVAEVGEGVVLGGGGADGLIHEDDIAEFDVLEERGFAAPVDGGGVFRLHGDERFQLLRHEADEAAGAREQRRSSAESVKTRSKAAGEARSSRGKTVMLSSEARAWR